MLDEMDKRPIDFCWSILPHSVMNFSELAHYYVYSNFFPMKAMPSTSSNTSSASALGFAVSGSLGGMAPFLYPHGHGLAAAALPAHPIGRKRKVVVPASGAHPADSCKRSKPSSSSSSSSTSASGSSSGCGGDMVDLFLTTDCDLIKFRPHSDLLTSGKVSADAACKIQNRQKCDVIANVKRHFVLTPYCNLSDTSLSDASSSCHNEAQNRCASGGDIYRLFPELLSTIFEYLDVASKGRAAQVCCLWRDSAYVKSVWKGVEAKLHLRKSNPTLFSSLTRRGIKKVQVLSLRRSLRELIHGMPNLESLNLSGCYNLSESVMDTAFTRPVLKLKELNVSLCKEISDNSLGRIATNCKNLEVLDLGGCIKVTNNGLLLLSWGLKNLKKLNLRSCRQITDHGIGNLCGNIDLLRLSEGAKNLEELGLQDCQKLTDKALKYISLGLPKLNKINLSFCVSITDTGLKSLAKAASLTDLNVCSCDNVSDIGIAFLAKVNEYQDSSSSSAASSCCSALEKLNISFCSNVSDSGIKHIANGMASLKELYMANCGLTDDSLIRVAKGLQQLRVLNIGQCSKITDASVAQVAKHLAKTLQKIDLYGCNQVTKEALQQLSRQMPTVSQINVHLWPK